MPQMAPLYWETLFFMFIISLMLMSAIIYHMPKNVMESNVEIKMNNNQANWKW
uniref:ATP synthase complex subunit 8 n=1 Tax=Sphyrocoris obliquus TaxID=2080407 RepID=A0A2P1CLU5_9HEMI|nr:ATP synthase F0 subunit 8 [Sphyrocoris obliquus]